MDTDLTQTKRFDQVLLHPVLCGRSGLLEKAGQHV